MPPPSSIVGTWRALLAPRRLLPVGLVATGLVATELWATRHPGTLTILVLFVVLFVALMPAAWRWLHADPGPGRGAAYVVLGALLVLGASFGPIALFGREPYVAHPPAAAAVFTLVLIAGWILGRDIELSSHLAREAERSDALSRAAEDARLLAIRQHLDPHFLFNTLGAIAEWCREDPAVAERALVELSTMLRTLFEGIRQPLWPLRRELDVLLALHRLHALRDDGRYRLDARLEEAPAVDVPPLVLLPLFENALTHGGAAEVPMILEVDGREGALRVRLWNAGPFDGRRAEGTGIATTERRLALVYGRRACVVVRGAARDGVQGTEATVTVPLEPVPSLAAVAVPS